MKVLICIFCNLFMLALGWIKPKLLYPLDAGDFIYYGLFRISNCFRLLLYCFSSFAFVTQTSWLKAFGFSHFTYLWSKAFFDSFTPSCTSNMLSFFYSLFPLMHAPTRCLPDVTNIKYQNVTDGIFFFSLKSIKCWSNI